MQKLTPEQRHKLLQRRATKRGKQLDAAVDAAMERLERRLAPKPPPPPKSGVMAAIKRFFAGY